MANDLEKLTQELNKNYSKVQKRELDYVDYKASWPKKLLQLIQKHLQQS